MLLSTNKPIASAIPPRLIILRLMSLPYIRLKVATMDTGIEIEMMIVGQMFLRNRNSTNIARIPPIIAADFTSEIALVMKTD